MVTKILSPVKRHNALVKFSKEHHFGLLLCWKIRQGVMDNVSEKRIVDYVLHFFDTDLKHHFEEEEKSLFAKLSPGNDLRKQAVREHQLVYTMISNMRDGASSNEELLTFADTLEKHIRFEERVLFTHLQQKLSAVDLQALMNTHSANTVVADDNWTDKFWLV